LNYLHMRDNPESIRAMRAAAPKMAARYTWEKVLAVLFEKINLAKCQQGTILPWQVHPYPIVEKIRLPKLSQNTQPLIYEPKRERQAFRELEVEHAVPA
jgi:nicotinamide mononucleotide adenylyltransferase